MLRSQWLGIYEIFGQQRLAGKTTLMTGLSVDRCMDLDIYTLRPRNRYRHPYSPSDVVCNYPIFIDGIKPLDNEHWFWRVSKIKDNKEFHKLILGDELNSILMARNTKDMTQTQFANFVWQMPKQDCILFWTNNQLTGADLIIRDGTFQTLMPRFDEPNNRITFTVIHDYGNPNIPPEHWVFNDPIYIQDHLFDSYMPAK